MVIDGIYPLVNIQKTIENGPVEIVDLPIKHGDFPLLCKRLPEGSSEINGWWLTEHLDYIFPFILEIIIIPTDSYFCRGVG